jgi:peptidyl-tRNA hydrolase
MADFQEGDIKQVIVLNMETNMGIGRMAAQATHAAKMSILNRGYWEKDNFILEDEQDDFVYWAKECFTTVIVKVWGKDAMRKIRDHAKSCDIPTVTMEEDGWETAMAVGPAHKDRLFPVTGHLQLL